MRFWSRPFNPNGIWGFSFLWGPWIRCTLPCSLLELSVHISGRGAPLTGFFKSPKVIRDSVWVCLGQKFRPERRVWSLPRSWNLQIWGTQFWPMTRCPQYLMKKTAQRCFFRRSSWTWGFENVGDMQYELWPNMSDSWLLLSGTPEKKYLSRRPFRW